MFDGSMPSASRIRDRRSGVRCGNEEKSMPLGMTLILSTEQTCLRTNSLAPACLYKRAVATHNHFNVVHETLGAERERHIQLRPAHGRALGNHMTDAQSAGHGRAIHVLYWCGHVGLTSATRVHVCA